MSFKKSALALIPLLIMLSGCAGAVMNWRQTVGPPVVTESTARINDGRILVVNWNIHVGAGNISGLVEDLTAMELENGYGPPDFIFLIQEAFRRGAEVPSQYAGRADIPGRISPPSSAGDIEEVAANLGWSLYYVPSMRNGGQTGEMAEDRGNAIISNLALEDVQAIELPFVKQRRVALAALVRDSRTNQTFRVVVAHLDTTAPISKGWFLAGPFERNRQAQGLTRVLEGFSDAAGPLIVGADLNTNMGPLETADDTISRIVPKWDCNTSRTHNSGLVLDHVFARIPMGWPPPQCTRMNETYGSDHYPLVLSITSSITR